MARAVSQHIIPSAVKSSLERAAGAVMQTIRRIVGPTIFADPHKKTILVPVPDDGWAPGLRCGEFAVVDTTATEPEHGAFVLVRLSRNNLSFTKLRHWTDAEAATIQERSGKREIAYWSMLHGRQAVGNWRPRDESWAPGGHIQMSDGPAGDKFMREMIIGRVIGVLGANNRALNWKGEL